ncbi:hypothetical protein EMIT0P253_20326 [Pseudomonas sp. IT-P253]
MTNESLTDQRFRVKQVISHMQVRKRAIPTSCDYAHEVGLRAIDLNRHKAVVDLTTNIASNLR